MLSNRRGGVISLPPRLRGARRHLNTFISPQRHHTNAFQPEGPESSTSSTTSTSTEDDPHASLLQGILRAPLGPNSVLDPLGELDMTKTANRDALTRLQSLLKGVGDGEEELFSNMLSEESAENKVILHTAAGVLVLFGAFLLCVLIKSDPLGGMRFGPHSLAAGVVGLIAGMPLVVFRVALWSEEMRSRISGLRELQEKEVEYFAPLLQGLSTPQTLLVLALEVIPATVILLPGGQGGLSRSFALYCQTIVDALEPGAKVPYAIPEFLALVSTAAMAAIAQLINQKASQKEVDIIREAVDNADRYYRVMAVQPAVTSPSSSGLLHGGDSKGEGNRSESGSRASGSTRPSPEESAAAFKSVATTWIKRGQDASKIGGMLTALEVIYLGVLWRLTEDMASALVAGFFVQGIDFFFIRRVLDGRGVGLRKEPTADKPDYK